ncbi:aminotransferase class I/II-fold pyridoxal phosphate-dependent enzyme [Burkholderia sp. MS389]|uniref:MocR-like pyridoxine biosynthesis transcription factor PdxR n=1 Tax=Burkholderia TaxID=32008 RepID=UPI0006785521|nr:MULTISPECIES: PLP-dependent aminotransferase family protein [Burkholderia]KWU24007.1 GntR family transcriptional regulator [Burkholderia cenocepacia]OXI71055.1 PLP-dependent aminotransferase family protein [Burkholderia sp. AU31280]QRR15312.1 aminotransferase class I/II-fold pyridoxal phosphate-dependent enzyme [Burkholderia sp. MS389]
MPRGKAAIPLDLPRPAGLSGGSPQSKQECIADTIRDAILKRLLSADSPLPSSRTLAARWDVARGTVEAAYDILCAEGYIARTQGSGTRVCAVVPDSYLRAAAQSRDGAPLHAAASPAPAAAAESEHGVRPGVPFVARLADPGLLPMQQWKKALGAGLLAATADELGATPAQGVESLRAEIAAYLREYRGIPCEAGDIVITTGIRHAIDLVARTLLAPGSTVLMEDPGYASAWQIFTLAGATAIDVPVDREGIDTASLDRHPDARAAYVTPAHQAPLGVTMSVSRRLELLDWAQRHRTWIIEDDYDGEFSYQTAPLPALKSLDACDRVIYCGSFNKTLFSGLRIGFMVVPAALRPALSAVWHATARSVGVAPQLALARFIGHGDFAKHLRAARHAYRQRRDIVLDQLAKHAGGRYTVSGEHAGFHFVLWLPPGIKEAAYVSQARAAGIELQPIHGFCRSARCEAGVVVGYAALTAAHARHGGRVLGQLLAASA